MLKVKSFLKRNDDFIPVSEFTDIILDPNYIEGAIEISKSGNTILSIENWDYVDQLWCYFARGVKNVSEGKQFKTYLPDQPIEVFFKPNNNLKRVFITVIVNSESRIDVEYDEFFTVMIKEAREFFKHMKKLLPNSPDTSYASAEKDLKVAEKNLNEKSDF